MSTGTRILWAAVAIAVYGAVMGVFEGYAGLGLGHLAVDQLNGGDGDAIALQTGISAVMAGRAVATIVLFAVLFLLFTRPYRGTKLAWAAVLLGLLAIQGRPAQAYYSQTDYGEYVEILPNWTAFLIGETGDTKSNQAQFESQKYLEDNKVPAKRVTIPHVKLPNSGAWSNYYVPAARLIIVDRTPISREWVSGAERGTSKLDQGFRFETADSIGLSTAVVISAMIKPEDAAKYLYWFGVKQDASMTQSDEARFASVLYARSLAEVVDGNVHRTVQATLASEFGRRSTDDAIRQKAEIMKAVEKAVIDQYGPMGITITTLGYADQLNFDNKQIQSAIDDTYMSVKRAQSADAQMKTLPVQSQLLDLEIRRKDAESRQILAGKWNGSVSGFFPSWVVLPSDVLGSIKSWWSGPSAPATAPMASQQNR